jgi:hypothetical protein
MKKSENQAIVLGAIAGCALSGMLWNFANSSIETVRTAAIAVMCALFGLLGFVIVSAALYERIAYANNRKKYATGKYSILRTNPGNHPLYFETTIRKIV